MKTYEKILIGIIAPIIAIAVIVLILLNLLGIVIAFEVFIFQTKDVDHLIWYEWLALFMTSDLLGVAAFISKDGN